MPIPKQRIAWVRTPFLVHVQKNELDLALSYIFPTNPHVIVFFSVLRRAQNRALFYAAPNRALFCVVRQTMLFSAFPQAHVKHQIVLFSVFRRTPNHALVVSSCTKSCSFLRFVAHQTVLLSFLRAPNHACSFLCFVVHQTVLFSAFLHAAHRALFSVRPAPTRALSVFRRAPDRALFSGCSCATSCSFLCFIVPNHCSFSTYVSSCTY